jgi:hypothetical protein
MEVCPCTTQARISWQSSKVVSLLLFNLDILKGYMLVLEEHSDYLLECGRRVVYVTV